MTKNELNKVLNEHRMYVENGSVYYLHSSRLVCRYFLEKVPKGYHIVRIAYFTKSATQETKNLFRTLGLLHRFKVGE